jgi:hypothetical protein
MNEWIKDGFALLIEEQITKFCTPSCTSVVCVVWLNLLAF